MLLHIIGNIQTEESQIIGLKPYGDGQNLDISTNNVKLSQMVLILYYMYIYLTQGQYSH